MKRILSFVMALVLMASGTAAYAYQVLDVKFEEIEAHVTGADKDTLDVKAYKRITTFEDGDVSTETLLPLREVCEYYGMTVTWNGADQSVTVNREDFEKPYIFYVGKDGSYLINGKTYTAYCILPCNAGYTSDNYLSFKTTENKPITLISPKQ